MLYAVEPSPNLIRRVSVSRHISSSNGVRFDDAQLAAVSPANWKLATTQDEDNDRAPAATVTVAAVTVLPSAAPIANTPAVTNDHVPIWVTAVAPDVVNDHPDEFVFALDAAAFHVAANRVTPAYSDAPVVPVVAVCRDAKAI